MKQSHIQALRALVAAAVVGAALTILSGCTMVSDKTTGVSLSHDGSTDCVRACNRTFIENVAAETRRSLQNLEACKRLPTSDEREACVRAELARYKAALETLSADRTTCVNSCHTQGSGSAG